MRRVFVGLVLAYIAIAFSASDSVVFAQAPEQVCITRWEWVTGEGDIDFWRTPFPENTLGQIDLRSIPEMSQRGPIPQGYGLFVLDSPNACVGPNVLAALNGDIDASIRVLEKTALEMGLGLNAGSVTGNTYRDVYAELLREEGDPTGQARFKPVRGTRANGWKLTIGGYGDVARGDFDEVTRQNTIDIFRADFTNHVSAGVDENTLRNFAGAEMLKIWGVIGDAQADILLLPEHRHIGFQRPETQINDTFDRGDAESLGTSSDGDWSWATEVAGDFDLASNRAFADADDENLIYANKALSSDDHYAEFVIPSLVGDSTPYGPIIRKDANTTKTYYHGRHNDGTNLLQLFKFVGGSATQLGGNQSYTASANDVIRLRATSDDDVILSVNGSDKITQSSETSITGKFYTGMRAFSSTATSDPEMDDFEAADLSAPSRRVFIF